MGSPCFGKLSYEDESLEGFVYECLESSDIVFDRASVTSIQTCSLNPTCILGLPNVKNTLSKCDLYGWTPQHAQL